MRWIDALTGKTALELRAWGPRHPGEIWDVDEGWKTTWLMIVNGEGPEDKEEGDIEFGDHMWSCCQGRWDSEPCSQEIPTSEE